LDSWFAGGVVLCSVGPLKLLRAPVSERAVNPGLVPPRDPRHGRRLEVRDVLPGPPSRAEDELGFVEGVQALRRAVSSLSRLPDGGDRADLCQARGLANASVLTPGIRVGPIAGERETGVERTPAETGHLEEREDRLDRHLGGDLPADDHAPRGVDERDVGHPFGGVDGGPVRDSARVRTCSVKDPVNEIRGDVGTTASLSSSPLGDARRPKSGHCHEPGHLVPPDVVAGSRRGDDMSVWIPYLRSSPAGRRPGWGRGPRPRCLRGSADRRRCGWPAVTPVDELGGEQEHDDQRELSQPVDGLAVRVPDAYWFPWRA